MAGDLKEVGVEALVKGLQQFLGDMGKVNSSLDSTRSHGNLLTNMFGAVGDALTSFGREILNVAEYALGKILADAIEWVIQTMGELVRVTIEAGSEFQILELRLERLNFNALIESGMEYNEAAEEAVRLTKEQLEWIQKLAASTPYDAQDVANVYTLARSYSFGAEESEKLTESILDFAAGMGLGNTEIERIIINFGQMVQQGKVTGMEMRDLARGAFVPINDILKRMQEESGLTGEAFEKFRNSGEGVNAFMKAFMEIVEERFQGASERMAQTFKGASDNMLDLIKSIGGLQIVKPILDAVGEKLAGFVSLFTDNEQRWEALVGAASRIGFELVQILSQLFDLMPSGEELADSIVSGLQNMGLWLAEHRQEIVDFFKGIIDTIKDKVIPFIVDKLIPAIAQFVGWVVENGPALWDTFTRIGKAIYDWVVSAVDKISKWVTDNGPLISDFFIALGEIIAEVVEGLTGKEVGTGGFLDSLLSAVKGVMEFVVEHKEDIAKWTEALIRFYLAWQVLTFIFQAVIGAITGVIGFLMKLAAGFLFLFSPLGLLAGYLTVISGEFIFFGDEAKNTFSKLGEDIKTVFTDLWNTLSADTMQGLQRIGVTISEAWQLVVGAFALGWEKIKTGFLDGWTQAFDVTAQAIEDLKISLRGFWENTVRTFNDLWLKIKKIFTDLWTDLTTSTERGMTNIWNSVSTWATRTWQSISAWFGKIKSTMSEKIQQAYDFVKNMNWYTLGIDIINGMISGIMSGAVNLINAVVSVAMDAYSAAQAALDSHSPSKLFAKLGVATMQGMALGIEKAAGLATGAMEQAVGQMAMPAMSLPSMAQGKAAPTSNYNSTRNYNLTVNTSANTEPIMSDFNMMESLAG